MMKHRSKRGALMALYPAIKKDAVRALKVDVFVDPYNYLSSLELIGIANTIDHHRTYYLSTSDGRLACECESFANRHHDEDIKHLGIKQTKGDGCYQVTRFCKHIIAYLCLPDTEWTGFETLDVTLIPSYVWHTYKLKITPEEAEEFLRTDEQLWLERHLV